MSNFLFLYFSRKSIQTNANQPFLMGVDYHTHCLGGDFYKKAKQIDKFKEMNEIKKK